MDLKKLMPKFLRKTVAVTIEAIFVEEVWQEIQRLVWTGKVKKWFIVTPADYDYLKILYNLQISKIELANIMAERYRWMLGHGQELEVKINFTRLACVNNFTYEEQAQKLRQALWFMQKGLNVKPSEVMFGWDAYNSESLDLVAAYRLKLVDRKSYSKIYSDCEVLENILKKKKNDRLPKT